MSAFDRQVLYILIGLGALLAAIVLAGGIIGLPAPELVPDDGQVSANGPVGLRFSEPMLADSVEARLRMEPPSAGTFRWDGSAVFFWPDAPLLPGQSYTLRLEPGARSTGGRTVRKAQAWKITPRPAQVLYLTPSQSPELWRTSVNGQDRQQLTSTGGKVFDFAVSLDGSRIAYSVQNNENGFDLWEINRQGGEPKQLLPCAADWCTNPAYSPDGKTLAYSRRRAGLTPNAPPGVPRLWTIDLGTLQTDALYVDPNVGGFEPAWSPDGRYLAFFDGLAQGLRVLNTQTQVDFLLESEMGMVGAWSPDSRRLLYVNFESAETQPYVPVYEVNVETQAVQRVLGDEVAVDYSTPAWSPDGARVAVAVRPLSGSAGKQIFVSRIDGSQRQEVTNDPLYNHAAYSWDPSGLYILFQRFALGSSSSHPEVALWTEAGGTIVLLAEDAFFPRWLP